MTRDLDTEGPASGQQRIDVDRPKILDLFCGAGGAGMGYSQAGFDVTGVDIEAHPDNPHDVIVADALEVLTDSDSLQTFDAVHASPPCQGFTTMSNRYRGKGGKTDTHPRLIATVREHLEVAGVPYVIENVLGARKELRAPVLLRGGMFDLGVDRPRLFETSLPVGTPPKNRKIASPIGVYGTKPDGRRLWTRKDGSSQYAARNVAEGRRAMGIDWMTWPDLTEAIPPAYTRWIGAQLMTHLRASEPCDLGSCAAPRGHDGTCLEASGWTS